MEGNTVIPAHKMKRWLATQIIAKANISEAMDTGKFIYKVGSQFLIDEEFPVHILLELSRACNYSCPMCKRLNNAHNTNMSMELARKVVSEARYFGPTSFSLHLFGEPLLNSEWYNIVTMIKKAHIGNVVTLTTNGSMLNERTCRLIKKARIDKVFISVASFNGNVYKEQTGGKSIALILENIQNFIRYADKSKLYIRLFDDSEVPLNDVKIERRCYHNFADKGNKWSDYDSVERYPCWHPWFTIGVTVDGDTTVCCADFDLGLFIGNAYDDTIYDMWGGERVEAIRREHLARKFEACDVCKDCDVWQVRPNIYFRRQYD